MEWVDSLDHLISKFFQRRSLGVHNHQPCAHLRIVNRTGRLVSQREDGTLFEDFSKNDMLPFEELESLSFFNMYDWYAVTRRRAIAFIFLLT
jgi:hypothetical protein